MPSLSRYLILLVLLILSAFFAICESSLSGCNQIKLKVQEDEGSKSAKLVLKTLSKFDNSIIDILICTNVVHILFSVVSTIICIDILTVSFGKDIALTYGSLIATIVSTIIVFFFGEMLPKVFASSIPEKVVKVIIYPLVIIGYILTPISIIFRFILSFVAKIFKTKKDENIITEDDFQDIVDNIETDGQIEEEESQIIQSAVEFDDARVKEVMLDKDHICALNIEDKLSKEKLIDFIVDNNFSRIPVYRNDLNNIVGILHTRLLLKALVSKQSYSIEKLLTEPLIVTPNQHLDTVFDEFKKKRTHMAIVKDKDDNTLGLVTMEDVLEKLVGDIDESKDGGVIDE